MKNLLLISWIFLLGCSHSFRMSADQIPQKIKDKAVTIRTTNNLLLWGKVRSSEIPDHVTIHCKTLDSVFLKDINAWTTVEDTKLISIPLDKIKSVSYKDRWIGMRDIGIIAAPFWGYFVFRLSDRPEGFGYDAASFLGGCAAGFVQFGLIGLIIGSNIEISADSETHDH